MNLTKPHLLALLFLPLACASIDTQVDQNGAQNHHSDPNQTHASEHASSEAWNPFENRHQVDAEARTTFFDTVKSLEGNWSSDNGDTRFEITSNGSVIRETMMPGQPMEMVNMYSMDGQEMRVTHFCAGGNQPHMRAAQVSENLIVFESDGVSDLKEDDQAFMGSMTLKLVDEDHFEQHWFMHAPEGVSGPMIFKYQRVD